MQRSGTVMRASKAEVPQLPAVEGNHAFYRPRPPLDQVVDFFWVATTYAAQAPRERVLPSGALALVINLGAKRFEVYERDDAPEPLDLGNTVLCGGRARPLVIGTSVLEATMGVHFKPGGARPFFDVPVGELEDRVFSLDSVWGALGAGLRDRLLEAPTDAERVAILEGALLERARGPLTTPPLIRAALAAFEDPGLTSVADVRSRFDLSPKRLLRLFHDEVGLTPKAYWRVRRFRAALARLDQKNMSGAAVAAALGYADQAHFIREFRALSGGCPREYLADRQVGNYDHVAVRG
jgi:AraC-like DNA-binding protein